MDAGQGRRDVTGVSDHGAHWRPRLLAKNKPSSVVWCMGITQHHVGTANVRALSILQLALGNIGVPGGGANIYRGHDNVQGATDVGPNADSLPGYYGLAEGAWKHFGNVWGVDYNWMRVALRLEGVDGKARHYGLALVRRRARTERFVDQPANLRAVFYWGHAPNSQTRLPDMKAAMQKLDMLVVIDPYPSHDGRHAWPDRRRLPVAGGRRSSRPRALSPSRTAASSGANG